MAETSKAPGASTQTPLGGFTAPPSTLHHFHFVKIINVFYELRPSTVRDPRAALLGYNF